MAYNPNPPFNPSDYGNRPGGVDYQAMEDRLKDIREQIASFDEIPIRDTAAALEGNLRGQPVYGEGVPEYQSRMKDKSEYAAKGNYALPDYAQKALDQNTEYVNLIRQSVLGVPEEEGGGKDKKGKGGKGDKGGEKDTQSADGLKLPDLSKTEDAPSFTTPKRFLEGKDKGGGAPDFNKNPSFDGRSFEEFLKLAKAPQIQYVKGMERETGNAANPELAKIYNKLKDKGMSEDDMFKAAQYAGLTNIRTGKEGKSDYKQMIKAFENDFYKGKKSGGRDKPGAGKRNIYEWYLDQGGQDKGMNKMLRRSGVGDFDSSKDAEKFATYLTDQLNVNATGANIGMDEAKAAFGNRFGLTNYKAALDYEGQDKKYIKNYLKDYAARGGKVSDKVQALFPKVFPNSPSNLSNIFGGSFGNQSNMGPFAP